MENPEDFVSTALAKLREHFVVILTPPAERGGIYPCSVHGSHRRHSVRGGVLVPIDPICPVHDGRACWSGRRLSYFDVDKDRPSSADAIFVTRYTGHRSADAGKPTFERIEDIALRCMDDVVAFVEKAVG